VTRTASRTRAAVTFQRAVEQADHLRFVPGLDAIKRGEGRGRISVDPNAALGSTAIDADCKSACPNASRWDYAIGARLDGREHAFFVEVHSAETSGVSEVEKKLAWLLDFLRCSNQAALNSLPRRFHWVASGRVNIPKHVPQYKKLTVTLRRKGLLGPDTSLALP
jgi:hypothetical protein